MQLSKSLYTRGLQCPKSLWLRIYRKDKLTPPDTSTAAVFATGDKVGALACQLFLNGKKIEFEGTNYDEKIALTQKYIDEGVKNIYEATFRYDDVLVMIDILHINEDGSVEIYEVKSSTEVKDVYLQDASIQYYVLNGLGYSVKTTNIIHINNKYVRGDELEIDKLFSIVDISDKVTEIQSDIPTTLKYFENILANREAEPNIQIGTRCTNPYTCDAMAYCWQDIPDYSIFNISRLRVDKKFEMYENGIIEFDQVTNIESFSLSQQIQIESEQTNEVIINQNAIKEFIDGLAYPLYHLDFETFQQAIPEWKGIRPFMQIPFQYSLHIEQEDGALIHKEFLAIEGIDPRYELVKRLVGDIPTDVTVLAYNMGFEKGVIRSLAELFDEFAPSLMAIHDNIQDLMTVFQKKDYYMPSMRGSYSIKYVMPALVPEMAQAYKELELVQNGGDAMDIFPRLVDMLQEQKDRHRCALLEYCELDTKSMVEILKKLKKEC